MAKKSTKEEKVDDGPVGGFAFFLSLSVLIPVSWGIIYVIFSSINISALQRALPFGIGILAGFFIAHTILRGKISVFVHEFKHSFLAGLVGNKWKRMNVGDGSGSFEYSYSKKTSHYNAFISLAPYCLPVFTFLAALIVFALFRHDTRMALSIIGVGYGIDLIMNMRDISPIQTDLSEIRGGFTIGFLYVLAWNLSLAGVILSWALFGFIGWQMIIDRFLKLVMQFHGAGI